MRLVVALLRFADPRPGVDPLTGAVTRDAARATLGPPDAAALEHALRIGEAWDARVLAVCAGPPAATGALRDAIALGAEALRVPWPPGERDRFALRVAARPAERDRDAPRVPRPSRERDRGPALEPDDAYLADLFADERPLARALAAAIGSPDLVVCGDRSADRGTGALPALLAHELDAAQALGLVALRTDGGDLVAERRLDGGRRERLRVPRPAVCSVEPAGVRLRRAPLPAMLDAGRAVVPRGPEPAAARDAAVELAAVVPGRPRTRVVAPPGGATPHERLLALTGALVAHDPPVIVGPVDARAAADALLDFLRRNGYLDGG